MTSTAEALREDAAKRDPAFSTSAGEEGAATPRGPDPRRGRYPGSRSTPFVPLKVRGFPRTLAVVVLGVLILAASARIEVPMRPVPLTLQTYALLLVAALSGARLGIAAVAGYLACAAVGLPVLAGGESGMDRLLGPTAGYLVGFAATAALVGRLAERGWTSRGPLRSFAVMTLGHALSLGCGATWLAAHVGWARAWEAGLAPFLLGALLKSAAAAATIESLRRFTADRACR